MRLNQKLFTTLFCLGLGTIGFSQSTSSLNSVIEPSKSGGFACWNETPNATYIVRLMEKDKSGNFIQTGSFPTENNFARLSSVTSEGQGSYFSVAAYSNETGMLLEESDIQANIQDPSSAEIQCEVDCNGKTYAWTLEAMEVDGGPVNYVRLQNAWRVSDQATQTYTPYYQAISQFVYDQMSPTHPYKLQGSAGPGGITYLYDHIAINPATPGYGTFKDAQNNAVLDGYLIEKKMDQYAFMTGTSTPENPTPSLLCLNAGINSSGGWVDYYNTHIDQNTWGSPSNYPEIPNVIIPTQLGCNTTPSMGWADAPWTDDAIVGTVFDTGDGDPWTHMDVLFEILYGDPLIENPDPDPTHPAHDYAEITGYQVEPVNKPGASISGIFKEYISNRDAIVGLTEGLYRVILFTDNGIVFPFYFEQNAAVQGKSLESAQTPLSTTLIVELFPNPTSEDLRISISEKQSGMVTVVSAEGKELFMNNFEKESVLDLNTAILPAGLYYVNVTIGDRVITKKLIKR